MSCKEIVLNEIANFKSDFKKGGMTFDEYKLRSQQIKRHIDMIFEKYIKQARLLLFTHMIDMDQYLELKMKIERSRVYYKGLLNN